MCRLITVFGQDNAGAHQFWHRYERQIRRMLHEGLVIYDGNSDDSETDDWIFGTHQ
jgi:hypothetical protein